MTCLSEAKGLAWTRSASKDVFEGSETQLQASAARAVSDTRRPKALAVIA